MSGQKGGVSAQGGCLSGGVCPGGVYTSPRMSGRGCGCLEACTPPPVDIQIPVKTTVAYGKQAKALKS